ncbi:MAG: TIGR04283 family arsenosugar biosynthesis glycosyltransferase [Magnetococcales bacterium]|nr:TIGR04283 family arsenosugar biosynthesis glycosyltransferase [Magnetococcales bacterium]
MGNDHHEERAGRSLPPLSVIIPTLNEAGAVPGLIQQLHRQKGIDPEIIVADGGSTDDTIARVKSLSVRLCTAPKGRAAQMNRGVEQSQGELLLFLHADSHLTAPDQLARAVTAWQESMHANRNAPKIIAGHFPLRFIDQPPGKGWLFHFYEEKSRLNRAFCINGDQGFLLSRSHFEQLGGFDDTLPFFEDQRLARRLFQHGRWFTLPDPLETSARRFRQEGTAQRIALNALIMVAFHGDARTVLERTAQLYRQQDRSDHLAMRPILTAVQQEIRRHPLGERLALWRRLGRFVRDAGAWQLGFMVDLLLSHLVKRPIRPLLTLYDRVIHPVIRLAPFDWLAAGVAWLLFQMLRLGFLLED